MKTFAALPGGDLVDIGLVDLEAGRETVEALLVSIGYPKLRSLGVEVAAPLDDPEHRLYLRLAAEDPDAAHGRYNALVRSVTFRHADPYTQALAKLERGHTRDLEDVREFVARGLVDPKRLAELYDEVEAELYRFPAVDPTRLRSTVAALSK
jgi:hypothetical protein